MDIRENWVKPTRSAPAEAIIRPPQPDLETRCRVAMRAVNRNAHRVEHIISLRRLATGGLGKLFEELKLELCAKFQCQWSDLRLDHNPALVLREYDPKTEKYKPDANDPYFLRYMLDADHKIKTTVRGDHGARSDIAERQHRRRLDQNRGLRPKKQYPKIQSRGFEKPTEEQRANRKWWGSRKFQTRRRSWQG